jgi:hypothetical protein
MKASESLNKFTEFALSNGIKLRESTPRQGFQQMFRFYELIKPTSYVRAVDVRLLFQWGTNNWGKGKSFELNMTRQFVEPELQADDFISQLSLTYKFMPAPEFDAVGAGNSWDDAPSVFENFLGFVFSSLQFILVADKSPKEVELDWFDTE